MIWFDLIFRASWFDLICFRTFLSYFLSYFYNVFRPWMIQEMHLRYIFYEFRHIWKDQHPKEEKSDLHRFTCKFSVAVSRRTWHLKVLSSNPGDVKLFGKILLFLLYKSTSECWILKIQNSIEIVYGESNIVSLRILLQRLSTPNDPRNASTICFSWIWPYLEGPNQVLWLLVSNFESFFGEKTPKIA